ncbi:MAG: glycosyltransferase family 2 protein [bacterium]|nr:glycosyltransferase family 2 protein [bacterium]
MYWIMRLLYMNIFLLIAYGKLFIMRRAGWMERIEELDAIIQDPERPPAAPPAGSLRERIARRIIGEQVKHVLKSGSLPPPSDAIYHLVIIPVASEAAAVVEPGIRALRDGVYPTTRMAVVLAVEERADDAVRDDCRRLVERYRGDFMACFMVTHPDGIEGEAKVKGANVTCAARTARDYFERKAIPPDNVIVSCFDSDTVVSPEYFASLTFNFMVTPQRTRASYQPVPVYHNNIWEAHSFARVLDVGASFVQLIEDTDPEKRVTFSSHSMSFKALVEVGYWPVDIISDDSAIYWKSLIHFDGDYRVVPIYVTLSMDVNEGGTLWRTFKNIYRQRRRWAWGVENFPLVMRAFLGKNGISPYNRFRYAFKLFDRTITWSSWPFLYALISWLPILYAPREFSSMPVFYALPRIRGTVFILALTGILICVFLSLFLLPPKNTRYGWLRKIVHIPEWFLLPPITIFLTGLPALDAQTRLMLGRHMQFFVTPKYRREGPP